MSPQPSDPDVRRRLIEAAARVLGEDGPSGLSTRKLAAEVGTSTMAVYTYFGGLPGLVAAVADEGFARLADHLGQTTRTNDALADLAQLAMAYRSNALENPHLYAVMFGAASLGGYRRSREELTQGHDTFDVLIAATKRAMDEGGLAPADPEGVAGQLWSALHGYVTLELAGYLTEADGALEKVLWPLMANLVMALRADPSTPDATAAVAKKAITGRQPASPTTASRRSRSAGPAAGRSRKPGTGR
jgi:AcrR family transcriptional regulator